MSIFIPGQVEPKPEAVVATPADPISSAEDAARAAKEIEEDHANRELARFIGMTLWGEYPNHRWEVYVDIPARNVNIKNLSLSGNWGMLLHPKDWRNEKVIKSMAGELLERYNVARTRIGAQQAKEIMVREGKVFRQKAMAGAMQALGGKVDWKRLQAGMMQSRASIEAGPAQNEEESDGNG